MTLKSRAVRANGVNFFVLEAGTGPLALCLHGFPDSAHTWRHLLPALANAGFHAVAPFMRGYAPTTVPEDGRYQIGALAADAVALHDVLGDDDAAVLIGHDWGAEAAYEATALAPERWRQTVTISVPPPTLDSRLFLDYDQIKRFFYLFFFLNSAAKQAVSEDRMAFLDRLWQDWSPGYDSSEDLAYAKECLREPANLQAAIGYYLANEYEMSGATTAPGAVTSVDTGPSGKVAAKPVLYIHGRDDGCIAIDLVRDVERYLAHGSRFRVIEDSGHFPHLERPGEVNEHILAWVSR